MDFTSPHPGQGPTPDLLPEQRRSLAVHQEVAIWGEGVRFWHTLCPLDGAKLAGEAAYMSSPESPSPRHSTHQPLIISIPLSSLLPTAKAFSLVPSCLPDSWIMHPLGRFPCLDFDCVLPPCE